MKDLNIKIEFFSPWHCGSGLSAGADADSLVIKDINGLPFIPGKTIKGLIREAVEDYAALRGLDMNLRKPSAKQLPLKKRCHPAPCSSPMLPSKRTRLKASFPTMWKTFYI